MTGSTIVMKLVNGTLDMGEPRFQRFYVCFAAYKERFKLGYIKFFGVDGCHLKGPHKAILLAAVGVDANNSMFPIA